VTKVLEDLILEDCFLFLNNIGVKGLLSMYNDKEVILGVRQFVLKHIQFLDKTLVQLERVKYTIGPKS
jgi:hypothetical protein